ncbi:hypothetical protein ILYODFUR_039158 [Ilyodon furcidens]|uniref:Uncharacterized protein n=1 Tax=Ilyodon furcidens TaxID=33524 RepID=A0ABV0UYV8_9TELE
MGEFCAVWVGVWGEGGLPGVSVWVWGEGGIMGGSTSPVDFERETFCDDLSFSANWPIVSAGAVGGSVIVIVDTPWSLLKVEAAGKLFTE